MMFRHLTYLFFLWGAILCNTQGALAQRNLKSSDRIAPRWIQKPPVARTGALHYLPVTVYTSTPEAASVAALNTLTKHLPRNWNVASLEGLDKESFTERSGRDDRITRNTRSQVYRLQVQASGEPVELRCKVMDDYWQRVIIGGNVRYRSTILYQVAAPGTTTPFENAHLTTAYGARGLWRSAIIPGWGQFHKGANLKGGLILGGCALLAGGIVFTENQRADYDRKIKRTHDIGLIRSYTTKKDHFATARNICIGAAAALYLYNLIDAVAAPGARRIVVKRGGRPERSYAVAPALLPDGAAGLTAAMSF